MRYKEKKEKRESRQGSGFDSQGCEGMAPLSLAVRSRSRDLKVLSCLSAERKRERERKHESVVAINYCSTDDFARAEVKIDVRIRCGAREEEDVSVVLHTSF